ncbi:MAG: hypothetical protein OXN17_10430 [Candidatus Poribacteria bacterium]|nr:hypothetical protein [Candidatus Poribacteria bacterium]MDE0504900.1 hypothetical protein [Candidatus Poribacteria bacterium]
MRWNLAITAIIVAFILGIASGLLSANASVISLGALIIFAGFPLIAVFSRFNDKD